MLSLLGLRTRMIHFHKFSSHYDFISPPPVFTSVCPCPCLLFTSAWKRLSIVFSRRFVSVSLSPEIPFLSLLLACWPVLLCLLLVLGGSQLIESWERGKATRRDDDSRQVAFSHSLFLLLPLATLVQSHVCSHDSYAPVRPLVGTTFV